MSEQKLLASKERQRHIKAGRYLKDVVFAANDGIVTTFAVVAGTAGASLSPTIVLVVGFANLLADGFSMASGNYLGTKSEDEFYDREEGIELDEVENIREHELAETRELLEQRGYLGQELENLLGLIASNKQFWIDFMMHEELRLFRSEGTPFKNTIITFSSFAIAGFIPLVPYVLGVSGSFYISAITGGIALFIAGALRKFFLVRHWFLLGLEMLFVGGFAGLIAYGVGVLLKSLFGI